ncbi:MAG: hypothetical protein J6T65_08850 [Clostridia bacterium]|nr:hypothetical protein [Clostridia bacterium]
MDNLFFSEKLKTKLGKVSNCALTALEAPAGYGKTTAIRQLFKESDSSVRWFTAVEGMADNSYRWFTRQLGAIDDHAARDLQDLGYLNRSNAAQAARIISEMRPSEPLTLIFDNFQFALNSWQPQVLDALAKCEAGGLRTVFISQNFGRLRDVLTALEENICYIGSRDLLLSERDIGNYARQLGITATQEEIREVFRNTDGWTAAVSLYLENLREGVRGSGAEGLDDLLSATFWQKLTDAQREAMLRICLFDQIKCDSLDSLVPPDLLSADDLTLLLRRAPLILYRETRRAYYPHELLTGFLRRRLESEDDSFKRAVLKSSAEQYLKEDMVKEAVGCYYRAGDYEAILACDPVCMITEDFDGVSYTEVVRTVLTECPEEVKRKYPYSLLRQCYALYAGCEFDGFRAQMLKIRKYPEISGDPQLLGEWTLVYALNSFPNLDWMTEQYKAAEKLMTAPSKIFIKEEPFMFGCASMWYLFYNEPGKMLETADKLAAAMKIYNRLTNGHGAGAAEIYRGEALSVQGRFEESDIQAYQAAFLSEQSGNATATYGAALLLGINAIYRSDMVGLQKAVDYLENKAQSYSFLRGRTLGTYMIETVRGYLLGLMMETGRSALWTQGEADSLTDLTFTNFMIKTCRITDLLLKKEYKQAIASVEAALQLDRRLISVSTKNFMYCGLALGYLAIGRPLRAAEYLDKSLTIAGQDKNYTFLACFRKYFQVLFLMPQIASKHAKTIREIKALDIRYTRADESHIFEMLEEVPELREELTAREREVAELAAKGLRNAEIAEALFISENTVKHHLKIAFQKMNIDRRSRLIDMLR